MMTLDKYSTVLTHFCDQSKQTKIMSISPEVYILRREKLYYLEDESQRKNKKNEECADLGITLGQFSSSSSLSWSDEYESEATKEIYEKLKRIDRVLKKQEDIPPHYDKDEFEQWMTLFPNISIFDPPQSCSSKDTLVFSSNSSKKQDKVNKEQSVINSSEFTYNRLLTQRSANNRKRHVEEFNARNKNVFTISSKPKSVLKITPLRRDTDHKLSAKSLKAPPVSNIYTEFPQQFDSLPFIEIDDIYNGSRQITNTLRNKKCPHLSSNLGKRTDLLILPPIQGDRFRSISATPTQDKPSKFCLI